MSILFFAKVSRQLNGKKTVFLNGARTTEHMYEKSLNPYLTLYIKINSINSRPTYKR